MGYLGAVAELFKDDAFITTAIVNMREDGTTASKVLKVLPIQTTGKIIERKGDWYKIRLDGGPAFGYDGWVYGEYIKKSIPLSEIMADKPLGSEKLPEDTKSVDWWLIGGVGAAVIALLSTIIVAGRRK